MSAEYEMVLDDGTVYSSGTLEFDDAGLLVRLESDAGTVVTYEYEAVDDPYDWVAAQAPSTNMSYLSNLYN